jgi:hypothetical protein
MYAEFFDDSAPKVPLRLFILVFILLRFSARIPSGLSAGNVFLPMVPAKLAKETQTTQEKMNLPQIYADFRDHYLSSEFEQNIEWKGCV